MNGCFVTHRLLVIICKAHMIFYWSQGLHIWGFLTHLGPQLCGPLLYMSLKLYLHTTKLLGPASYRIKTCNISHHLYGPLYGIWASSRHLPSPYRLFDTFTNPTLPLLLSSLLSGWIRSSFACHSTPPWKSHSLLSTEGPQLRELWLHYLQAFGNKQTFSRRYTLTNSAGCRPTANTNNKKASDKKPAADVSDLRPSSDLAMSVPKRIGFHPGKRKFHHSGWLVCCEYEQQMRIYKEVNFILPSVALKV